MSVGRQLINVSLVCLAVSSPVWAQATRTWVSGTGDDVNPCSRTAPCKTFQGAISKTAVGGEIDALDSAGFGSVTITKAITLDARAVLGSVLTNGTPGITINIQTSTPADVVILRGLSFISVQPVGSPAPTGDAIKFLAGTALHVEDCTIQGFANGINMVPPAGKLFVKNTRIVNPATSGILFAGAQATIDNSSIFGAPTGIDASGTAVISVHETVVAESATAGVHAGTGTEINLEGGLVADSVVGINGEGTVRISDVMMSHNVTGLTGSVTSFGNNRVAAGNTTDGAPTAALPQQ